MNKYHILLPLITGSFLGQLSASCSRKSDERLSQVTNNTVTEHKKVDTGATYELILSTGLSTLYSTGNAKNRLRWEGSDIAGRSHKGTLELIAGKITTSPEGKITNGNFTIDMNSIKNTVNVMKRTGKMEEHLKSDDFFSVAKFPKAYFSITTVTPLADSNKFTITGNLKLKGVENIISFPATIKASEDHVIVQAEISIDRTKWGINYQSESLLGKIKDEAIANKIKVLLNLLFNKKDQPGVPGHSN